MNAAIPLVRPKATALLLLALAVGALWAGKPSGVPSSGGRSTVPATLGLWIGKPLQAQRRVFDILETDDVSLMEYHLGQEPPLWLAQVAGFGNRAAFHPPELCYVGSHFEVLERGPILVTVNGQPRRVMRLLLAQGGRRFETWYWFTANGRMTPSYYQQQLWLLANAIRQRPSSGTLVRISTPIESPKSSKRRLLAFVTSWDTAIEAGMTHGS